MLTYYFQIALVSALAISVSCMVIHQRHLPTILIRIPQELEPSYNFAYEVNDYSSGDIKSQTESRSGDTILGQYSLLQPDGVKRTVDYRADDLYGFRATVQNDGNPASNNNEDNQQDNASEENQSKTMEEQQGAQNQDKDEQIPNLNSIPRSLVIQSVPNSEDRIISSVLHQFI